MQKIAPYYKAIAGALVAFLTSILTALEQDGISTSEWITAIIALIIAGGAVFAVPNAKPSADAGAAAAPAAGNTSPPSTTA